MANQIPFSGAQQASGGYLLPPEQGEILVQGILVETGAIQLAGDARSTRARKTNFPIWLGRPTAGPVAEGAAKGVTGASFGQATLNIQKFASIVLFTDEQIEDLQNGDLNVLADAGVRQALSVSIDAHSAGMSGGQAINGGSVFDSTLAGGSPVVDPQTNAPITLGTGADALQKATSAAMGVLEANGYGNPADMGSLLGFGFQRQLRDARDSFGRPLYDGGTFGGQSIDPLYAIDRAHSTNLASLSQDNTTTVDTTSANSGITIHPSTNGTIALVNGAPITGANIPANSFLSALAITYNGSGVMTSATATLTNAAGTAVNATGTASAETAWIGQCVATVVHRPNIHVRIRDDVRVKASNEASIVSGGTTFNLFQQNLTALLYEARLGYLVHDQPRSVVPIWR